MMILRRVLPHRGLPMLLLLVWASTEDAGVITLTELAPRLRHDRRPPRRLHP